MRFLYAKLTGYIGIYNGLGLNEIEIDFTKCKNKICVIRGANGSGKSTLLNALSILPDGNENFVPGYPATKQLRILDEGMVYDICINHPLDGKGNRSVTKVSIQKNGIELNPNGNVGSYKDIIFNEFDLDSNFITLSHLSGDDRGLADKKPADRKKFLASITSSLETYNGIYKNLNKKSNVYKSYINGLTGKISNIGSEDSLKSTMNSLANRFNTINQELEAVKANIIQEQTIASMNDPNGELQKKYTELEQEIERTKKDFTNCLSFFNRSCSNINIENNIDVINTKKEEQTKLLEDYQKNLDFESSSLRETVEKIKNLNDSIEKDKVRVSKLSKDIDPNIENALNQAKSKLDSIQQNFNSLGIQDPEELTKNNIDQIINILDQFINLIDIIYESLSESELSIFTDYLKSGKNFQSIIDENLNKIHEQELAKLSYEDLYRKTEHDLSIVSELDKRPKKCKIDSCPYISDSLSILKSFGSKDKLIKIIDNCQFNIDNCDKIIDKLKEEHDFIKNMLPMSTKLDTITRSIEANHDVINKIGIIRRIIDYNDVIDRISRADRFNECRDLKELNYISNDIIEYKSISSVYQKLLTEYNANKNNLEFINEYNEEIATNTKKIEELYETRNSLNKDITFLREIIEKTKTLISNLDICIQNYNDMKVKEDLCNSLEEQYIELQKQFAGAEESIKKISVYEQKKIELQSQLKPILDQKQDIESRLLLLDNYKKEYNEYSEKYNLVNTLKKHSSPTAGGIQTFFMNIYMGKTLEMANQLLGMIFQGQYQLLDYVITADEFRMPFLGSGLIVDDITSGSTSQVCIMGMIINLSLLNQASTKYNITRLDEIDGGLDYSNRAVFMQILQRVIDILGIEQLFIISHNMESYNGGTDAIQLSPIEGIDDNSNGSNIIYHY